MATKRAGNIVIDITGSSARLRDEVTSADAKLKQLGQTGRQTGRYIGDGMMDVTRGVSQFRLALGDGMTALDRYYERVLHVAEGVVTLGSAYPVATAALSKYGTAAASSASAFDNLLNGLRAFRLALSPTPITAATIATGVLVEETLKLVNARAKLIDQQTLFAAKNGLSFQDVDQLDLLSRVSGANQGSVRSLFSGLQSQYNANPDSVSGALQRLGVSGGIGDPAVLGRIASGLQSIADPARQAQTAVQLFGDQAGEALQVLNTHFANSARSVQQFGIVLDEVSRTQIHQFRQDLLSLRDIIDFSGLRSRWDAFKTGAEIVGAAAEDMSKRAVRALDEMIGRYMPGMTTMRALVGLMTGYNATQQIPIPGLPPAVPGAGGAPGATQRVLYGQDLFADMEGAQRRREQTLTGQRGIAEAAQNRADDLRRQLEQDFAARQANPKTPGLLSDEQRATLATQQKSAADLAAATERHVQEMEAAEKAAKDAAKAADADRQAIDNYERIIREQALSPVEKIFARAGDLGFAPGTVNYGRATTAATGEAQRYLGTEQAKVDDRTREIFGYTGQYGYEAGRHIPGSAEMGLKANMTEVNKQLDKGLEEWAKNVYEGLKNRVVPLQQVSAIAQQRSELAAQGGNEERRLQIQAQYDSQRVHSFEEQLSYQRQISALEADNLQIQLARAQQNLADAGDDQVKQAGALYELDRARLAVEEQRLQAMVFESQIHAQNPFADGSLKSGWDEFIREANAQAKQPGEIFRDSLIGGIDALSGAIGRVASGQKANWGRTLQSLGGQITQEAAKAGLEHLFGGVFGKGARKDGQSPQNAIYVQNVSLGQPNLPSGTLASKMPSFGNSAASVPSRFGHLFGSGGMGGFIFSLMSGRGSGKEGAGSSQDWSNYPRTPEGLIDRTHGPTGWPGDPVHVTNDDSSGSSLPGLGGSQGGAFNLPGSFSGLSGLLGSFGGLFSGGASSAAESVSSSISFGDLADAPGFAGGGVTPAGSAYWVGEHGPELEMNAQPHTVVPLDKLGGGNHTHVWHVDARGADMGAAGRIEQAINLAHDSAVRTAIAATRERNMRTPRRT